MYKPTELAQISPDEQALGGWIAPDGTFFQAMYYQHEDVAQYIVDGYLNRYGVGHASAFLEKQGWIRLETSGDIHHFPLNPTGQQFDVLLWCYTRAVRGWYKDQIFEYVEQIILEAARVKEKSVVPAQGDQENTHWTQAHRRLVWDCAFCQSQEGVYA